MSDGSPDDVHLARDGRLAYLRERLGGRIAFGGDYNPEQWPESVWAEDVALMQEAGVNLVTVGVFSWARLQPQPGSYDFGWLDRVLDLLHDGGIAVDLATATASPPPWLARVHPETLPVDVDGVRRWPGARQHYCPSSPAYRSAAVDLATALAARYGGHPALALWHVGNEYGAHTPACYCDVSAADFRRWLRERYGDVEALNEAWGTTFWSQRYGSFDEVWPPRRTPYFPNPAQELDFRRFSSDALLACFLLERDVLRTATPDVPVTTNFMGFFEPLDYWSWAGEEDVVSTDTYQDLEDPLADLAGALDGDLMRSLGGGRPWLLMEQAPSAINWRDRNPPKGPGLNRLWSFQAVAHGADAVLYFQWRASRSGAERFHSGMVPHAGTDSRVWRETVALGRELAAVASVVGSRIDAQVAIVHSWPSWWAAELPSRPSVEHSVRDQLRRHYAPLWSDNVTVAFVPPGADLSAYRLVVVPNLYLVDDAAAAGLVSYVRDGGHLLMSYFSGIVDETNAVRLGGYPAPFVEMLGVRVEEFWPLRAGETVSLDFAEGSTGVGTQWSEAVALRGAEVLGSYASGELTGGPAVTRHGYGAGVATYVSTRPDEGTMAALLRRAWTEAGVTPALASAPAGVEAVRRGGLLFLLNHGLSPVEVSVPGRGRDLLGGAGGDAYDRVVGLGPRGVAVLRPE